MILQTLYSKIKTLEDLQPLVKSWKSEGSKVVFTNGCFDILHAGHVTYLAEAAECGNKLIIGLNTDRSVKGLKESNRPVIGESQRALLLAALQFTDAVVLFDADTPLHLITALQPDVLVKGGDYTIETIVGAIEVIAGGGKVTTIPLIDGLSTSNIIRKIKESY